ncbi:protein of unknown function [Micropruina glycogenica]|uniref:Uncharacterized protein n=1 Tax=Micropruina glycogenica TaxID=75385 RepID=A0A2N9JIG9_9ACTN|nr:protein of unknown function [Micropruina glycogenica]
MARVASGQDPGRHQPARAVIDPKHVASTGTHRDESDTLWLDGIATKPARPS